MRGRGRRVGCRVHQRTKGARAKLRQHVLGRFDHRRAVPDEGVAPPVAPREDAAGHGHDGPALFEGEPGGDERPAALGRLDDHGGERQAADDTVPGREMEGERRRARRQLAQDHAAARDLHGQPVVLGRVDDVDARAEHGGGLSAGSQRGPVRRRIDAPGHPAHDERAGCGRDRRRGGTPPRGRTAWPPSTPRWPRPAGGGPPGLLSPRAPAGRPAPLPTGADRRARPTRSRGSPPAAPHRAPRRPGAGAVARAVTPVRSGSIRPRTDSTESGRGARPSASSALSLQPRCRNDNATASSAVSMRALLRAEAALQDRRPSRPFASPPRASL